MQKRPKHDKTIIILEAELRRQRTQSALSSRNLRLTKECTFDNEARLLLQLFFCYTSFFPNEPGVKMFASQLLSQIADLFKD